MKSTFTNTKFHLYIDDIMNNQLAIPEHLANDLAIGAQNAKIGVTLLFVADSPFKFSKVMNFRKHHLN